jgi:hypothetical protein
MKSWHFLPGLSVYMYIYIWKRGTENMRESRHEYERPHKPYDLAYVSTLHRVHKSICLRNKCCDMSVLCYLCFWQNNGRLCFLQLFNFYFKYQDAWKIARVTAVRKVMDHCCLLSKRGKMHAYGSHHGTLNWCFYIYENRFIVHKFRCAASPNHCLRLWNVLSLVTSSASVDCGLLVCDV